MTLIVDLDKDIGNELAYIVLPFFARVFFSDAKSFELIVIEFFNFTCGSPPNKVNDVLSAKLTLGAVNGRENYLGWFCKFFNLAPESRAVNYVFLK